MKSNCVEGDGHVPCLFIFGDSYSDSGNNNNLPTVAKVNYHPYGIDFPSGPTGRFNNGLTLPDFLTQFLGFEKLIPPFADTSGSDILKGVNYASGAAGIRFESGKQGGFVVDLGLQVKNHKVIVSEIGRRLGGDEAAEEYLKKCLYLVNIGTNDYINNYFMPLVFPTSRLYNTRQYAQLLIHQYSHQIKALESVGARKFGLFGLFPLGCIPNAILTRGTAPNGSSSCVQEQNRAVSIFNHNLKSLVDQLNTNNTDFPDAKFTFVNTNKIFTQILHKPHSFGFKVTKGTCCKISSAITGLCFPLKRPCENRDEFVFWDGIHTSQALNRIIAISSYNNSIIASSITSPMDISQLARF
ncbi:GDSL esterase/lipase [Senna tora]|uniref:GDSL esterase/lipase n=1 Tax=Senna tora TaxID=362788 RepID=A0A834SF93_9FABA|nr:GDSL esterase/lipase [Senna tora]